MEKNEGLITTLSSINNEILREQTSGINELNELINDKEIENIIKNKKIQKIRSNIEKNNKKIKSTEEMGDFSDYLKEQNNIYNEEIKKAEILMNEGKLNIQEIFNISVENNFVEIFKYIMKNYRKKIDINARVDNFRYSLIFEAFKKEEDEIFKILLTDDEIDFNNNGFEDFGDIFYRACKQEKLDYVKLILEEAKRQNKKVDVNIYNGTPLRNACLSGNAKLVECLLSLDDIKIDLEDGNGDTIFMFACNNEKKEYECAKLLYNEYKKRNITFDINKKNKGNITAIYYACLKGNIDLVEYFFSIPDINDIKDFSFFPAACISGNIKLVQLLYNRFYDKIDEFVITKAFACAIDSKNINLVKYLIKVIPDIENKIDFNSEIFIDHFNDSFSKDNLEMVKLLHDKYGKKININLTNNFGDSTFHYACRSKNPEIVKFLLSKQWKENIDINIVNEDGVTPFIIACEKGYSDIAKMLYDKDDFDREKNKLKKNWIEYFEKTDIVGNQTRTFKEYKNNIFMDTVYNINDINKIKPLYQIKYSDLNINEYPKMITYFIGDKSFTATRDNNSNIKFNFEGLEGITSKQFEEEMNKILNSFENVDNFSTYISWLPLALIEFKKQERQKNQNIVINDEIEFFDVHEDIDTIQRIVNNNLKNKGYKILVCDFSFSPEELSEDINNVKDEKFEKENENCTHAIPLVIFNSKDVDGNPQTKILAFNTGFKSKKAFEKLEKKLGNDVEIIKIDKDLLQKYGSCNISPKPMVEALFSSFMNELGEGESLVDKFEQYSQDMIIANRLAKLYKEHGILSEMRKTFFSILEKLNIIKSEQDSENTKNTEKTENTKLTNNVNDVESSPKKQKMETKEEILEDINLEKYLKRLKKYKLINEILVKKYKLFYSDHIDLYLDYNSGIGVSTSLNNSLNKAIKEVKKEQDRQEKELNELILRP